tara:strand:+ start:10631 stop:11863 length:1233 start_codon:yes stop_codon:yes gene_type:complete
MLGDTLVFLGSYTGEVICSPWCECDSVGSQTPNTLEYKPRILYNKVKKPHDVVVVKDTCITRGGSVVKEVDITGHVITLSDAVFAVRHCRGMRLLDLKNGTVSDYSEHVCFWNTRTLGTTIIQDTGERVLEQNLNMKRTLSEASLNTEASITWDGSVFKTRYGHEKPVIMFYPEIGYVCYEEDIMILVCALEYAEVHAHIVRAPFLADKDESKFYFSCNITTGQEGYYVYDHTLKPLYGVECYIRSINHCVFLATIDTRSLPYQADGKTIILQTDNTITINTQGLVYEREYYSVYILRYGGEWRLFLVSTVDLNVTLENNTTYCALANTWNYMKYTSLPVLYNSSVSTDIVLEMMSSWNVNDDIIDTNSYSFIHSFIDEYNTDVYIYTGDTHEHIDSNAKAAIIAGDGLS